MNGTFRYHISLVDPLKSAVEQFLAARSDAERERIRKENRKLIEQDDLLCQFRNDGHRREILFDPDAEYPVQIQLGTPEMDLRTSETLLPKRLRGYTNRMQRITAVVFRTLHPEQEPCDGCDGQMAGTYHWPDEPGLFMYVNWEPTSGGRYRLVIDCQLEHTEFRAEAALSKIQRFVENFGRYGDVVMTED